ncbi:MAG: AMP-binding protein [Deltaproteobacteria bacterium]|nr:AMP-binding protein [Deltaproteobacteria bacterium]
MRVVAVATREVAWPLDGRGAARGRGERCALLLEVRTATGALGLGEAAPLPGTSRDTLADAARAFAALAARVPFDVTRFATPGPAAVALAPEAALGEDAAMAPSVGATAPGEIAAAGTATGADAVSIAAAVAAEAPAARFAIEAALGAALAEERGVGLAELLAGVAGEPEVAHVVDDAGEARRAFEAGVRTLKVKVGPGDEVERIRAIAAAAPGVRLRLDANRCWPRDGVRARLAALAGLPIDFVEEPCPGAHELLGEPLPLPLPIALDESLAMADELPGETSLGEPDVPPAPAARGAHAPDEPDVPLARSERGPSDGGPDVPAVRGLAAVVLKPTLLGGLARCMELARRGVPAIASHALEGPIGTAACAELARAIGGRVAAGLGPHAALDAWSRAVPQLAEPARVRRAAAPGLGFGAVGMADFVVQDALSIERAARERGDAAAVITARATVSYADAARRARRSAPVPRAVVAHPSVETIEVVHAALEGGAPIALLHAKLPPAELARQREVVASARLPDGTAFVLFTSGSTGPARAVAIGRAAALAAAAAHAANLPWRDGDRWLCALSLAHAGGLAIAVRCLAARAPLVLLEPGDELPRALAEQRCTIASLVPSQLAALLEDPAWHPPPHLRAVLLGGAAAPPALLAAAAARGVPFLVTYGMTEALGQIATADPARAGDPTALPRLLSGVEVQGGTADAPARLRVRGPMLATCYVTPAPQVIAAARHVDHDAIAPDLGHVADAGHVEHDAIAPDLGHVDDAGHVEHDKIAPELTTGDLGHVDGDNHVHVAGRADDVIVSGGAKIHPAAIEAVVTTSPGVRAACAFAVADPRWGHVVGLAIAADPLSFDPPTAFAHWHAALPAHARPRELAVAPALPLSPTGKPDRRAAAQLPRTPVRY